MTLLELKKIIDNLIEVTPRPDQTSVVIKTSDTDIVGADTVVVETVSQGFDWDINKIILIPKQKLYKK